MPSDMHRTLSKLWDLMRDYQREAYSRWKNNILSSKGERVGIEKGIIAIPPGTGKTLIGLYAIVNHLLSPVPKRQILVLVPTRELAEQWFRVMKSFGLADLVRVVSGPRKEIDPVTGNTILVYEGVSDRDLRYTRAKNFAKNPIVPEKPITIMTYSGLITLLGYWAEKYPMIEEWIRSLGLVIMDEAHHLKRKKRIPKHIISKYLSQLDFGKNIIDVVEKILTTGWHGAVKKILDISHASFMGLSATPHEEEGLGSEEYTKYQRELHEMIEAGVLPKPSIRLVEYSRGEDKASAIASVTSELAEEGRYVLVLVPTVRLAHSVYRKLVELGVDADYAHHDRREPLHKFREKKLQVLVATPISSEGVDIPWLDTIVVAEGVSGRKPLIQRIGRILRPYPGKSPLAVIVARSNLPKKKRAEIRKLIDDIKKASALDPRMYSEKMHEELQRSAEKAEEIAEEIRKLIGDERHRIAETLGKMIEGLLDKKWYQLSEEDKLLLLSWYYYKRLVEKKNGDHTLAMDLSFTSRKTVETVKEWVEKPSRVDLPGLDIRFPRETRKKKREAVKTKLARMGAI